ncbi:MAG: bifunctional 5,10-methylenetetrahydrofolate dehydrogenase/5,10-methenyltetrahydrofolate cyclohydrolase [Candidatus Omnitrophica bacterium]|nr:bifunctional 5,10-methylenetetrahydrofolate dehydrogenase/5,10-methenyltetrahydrofolate cyclohydrolase [Candidatus Omnitrophota bacterium]
MSAQILDGKQLAKTLKEQLKKEVIELKSATGKVAHLINVMIGNDYSSCAYANSQKRVAEEIGLNYELVNLAQNVSQGELIKYIQKLNADPNVHGIMIHKPVPSHIDYHEVANCLDMRKDLEGINVANIGKMLLGETQIIPCTPAAVMEHLRSTGMSLRGKEVVVVGASEIVGKPLSLLLLREYATVSVCHIATSEAGKLQEHIGRAEILIVAVGKAELVKGSWIKNGAIVVDVGINQVKDGIVGDVEFEVARERASWITPVPGGVGPVTVVMLMRNGIEAFKQQIRK